MSEAVSEAPALPASGEYYFHVSLFKFAVMSLASLGLYQLYWFYRQWRFLKQSGEPDLVVVPRVLFSSIFSYGLFRRVQEQAADYGIETPWHPGLLTFGYIAASVISLFRGWFLLFGFANVLALLPVQRTMLQINAASTPPSYPDTRYSIWDVIIIVLGSMMLALIVIGLLTAPTP